MSYDAETLSYMNKTADQEMQEVLSGLKPAALGFWKKIPNELFVQTLIPIYGSYYKYAIALTYDALTRLIMAYYLPLSPYRDFQVGAALGYSNEAIQNYITMMKYPKILHPQYQEKWWKVKSVIQKYGMMATLLNVVGYMFNINPIRHIFKKEGLI